MSEPTNLDRTTITPCALVWRRVLDNGSMEFANVAPWGSGFELTGTIVAPSMSVNRSRSSTGWNVIPTGPPERF
jgi:hypothetical protein